MAIPDHVIEEVREKADIVEVIGEIVRLKRRGRSWVGLCPFHPEKTPSFNVTAEKGMYYCFGCQAGGNVVTFVMEYERLEFPDAVRVLAERVGVQVPEETRSAADPNAPLYAANRLAAEYYHHHLLESPEGEPARAYLAGRGVEREVWETFLLGWAPESWDSLLAEARRHGMDDESLTRAGLAGRSERTGGLYDRFRGRLCFPIRSIGGKVVAISGRRLDDGEPKYLNSADTPVFAKGRSLFNLDLARGPIRREGAAIVVEGNFDTVALFRSGYRNVVAPLGTAFTPEQARILRRYTGTAYLAYDGDRAGERAAFRAAHVLLAAGFAVRIVRLPQGVDPDAMVRSSGAESFETCLRESADVVDAEIDIIRARVDLTDVMKKRRAIERLLATVGRVPDAVTRSLYLDRIAERLGAPRESLVPPDRAAGRASPPAPRPSPSRAPGQIVTPQIQNERYVLLHAVRAGEWLAEARAYCRSAFFTVPEYARFFERLIEGGPGETEAGPRLERSEDTAVHKVLAELELWREEQGFPLSEESFRDSLQRLLVKAVERGSLPEFRPTGNRLADALRRREIREAILKGRLAPEAGPDV